MVIDYTSYNTDYRVLILIAVSLLNLLLGFFIFIKNRKNLSSFFYFLFAMGLACWSFGMMMYIKEPVDLERIWLWSLILHFAGSFIAVNLLCFSVVFPDRKNHILLTLLLYLPLIPIFLMLFNYHFIITDLVIKPGNRVLVYGYGYIFYCAQFFIYIISSLIILLKKYLRADGLSKLQLKYVFLAILVPSIFASFINMILPMMGNFRLAWAGPIFLLFIVVFIGYAILKHHLMNIKVIATEISSILLGVVMAIEIFTARTFNELIYKIIVFIAVFIFVILFIRSALNDVKQNEELQAINDQLKKNAKQLEKTNVHLKKLMEMRSEFLDIASHQLKTPVSVILGTASMFKEGSMAKLPQEKQNEFVDNIFKKAKKLSTIISDILRASEMDTDEFNLGPEFLAPIQAENVVNEVYGDLKSEAQERGLAFEVIKPPQPISPILASADYLEQAIFNLANNAVKYTDKGYVKIILSEERGRVIIKIEDSGIGIPADDQKKMFDKFARAKNAVNMYTDGSGLGLFIVKKIVEAHKGGQVSFVSEQNKGTTFTISLPIYKKP